MIPRGSRLALWCLALLLSLSLYLKGRAPAGKGEGAAFLRPHPGQIAVRLAGDFSRPGLYLFPDGITPEDAIKMTPPAGSIPGVSGGPVPRRLASGDIVTLKVEGGKLAVYSVGRMGVKERMLLGIPLDPDVLGPEEWSLLPGLGPVLSARIAADRQRNGAFGSLDGVLRVPGIGPGKLAAIRRYF